MVKRRQTTARSVKRTVNADTVDHSRLGIGNAAEEIRRLALPMSRRRNDYVEARARLVEAIGLCFGAVLLIAPILSIAPGLLDDLLGNPVPFYYVLLATMLVVGAVCVAKILVPHLTKLWLLMSDPERPSGFHV